MGLKRFFVSLSIIGLLFLIVSCAHSPTLHNNLLIKLAVPLTKNFMEKIPDVFPDKMKVYLDGKVVYEGDYSLQIKIEDVPQGSHTIKVVAFHKASGRTIYVGQKNVNIESGTNETTIQLSYKTGALLIQITTTLDSLSSVNLSIPKLSISETLPVENKEATKIISDVYPALYEINVSAEGINKTISKVAVVQPDATKVIQIQYDYSESDVNNIEPVVKPVESISATLVENGIKISWEYNSDYDYFEIYRKKLSDYTETMIGTTAQFYFVDEDIEKGVAYQYGVNVVYNGNESGISTNAIIQYPFDKEESSTGDKKYVITGSGEILDVSGIYESDPINITKYEINTDIGSNRGYYKQNMKTYRDYIYIINYSDGLEIIDISTPDELKVVSYLPDVKGNDLAVKDEYLYVINDADFFVYNISDKSSPTKVYTLSGYGGNELLLKDNFAYVVSHNGLKIVDISSPQVPSTVTVYKYGTGDHFYISDNFIFITSNDTIKVVDISDPSNPNLISSFNGNFYYRDIYVFGDYIYILSGGSSSLGFNVMHIINASDKSNLVYQGQIRVPDYSYGFYIDEDTKTFYIAGNVLSVLEIDDFGNYTYLGFHEISCSLINVSDDMVYVLTYDKKFIAINKHELIETGIKHVGTIDFDPSDVGNYGIDLYIKGNYAYFISKNSELYVADISNLSNPKVVGINYSVVGHRIVGGGNYIYILGEGKDDNYKRVYILDISDPTNPKVIRATEDIYIRSDYAKLFLRGNLLYVVGVREPWFYIINVSNPLLPKVVSKTTVYINSNTVASLLSIYVLNSYAYFVDSYYLYVIDVSNPESPNQVRTLYGYGGNNIYIKDNYAYITDGNELKILDISDPINPRRVVIKNVDSVRIVYVYGDKVYTKGYYHTLKIYNVSDKQNPTKTAVWWTPSMVIKGF